MSTNLPYKLEVINKCEFVKECDTNPSQNVLVDSTNTNLSQCATKSFQKQSNSLISDTNKCSKKSSSAFSQLEPSYDDNNNKNDENIQRDSSNIECSVIDLLSLSTTIQKTKSTTRKLSLNCDKTRTQILHTCVSSSDEIEKQKEQEEIASHQQESESNLNSFEIKSDNNNHYLKIDPLKVLPESLVDRESATNPQQVEVELISLVEGCQNVPSYKLRFDTATKFTGYKNNDWIIETPLIDLEAPIDLNPKIIRETFKLILQSGERLTQMTKVYDDVEALTKLLEEKERDVELAARIGQELLDQNQHQNERIDELEQELARAKDKITQLKHEVTRKKDLLRFYITKDEEDGEHEPDFYDDENTLASITSQHSFSNKDASQILEELERKVSHLEEENNRLKSEKEIKSNDLEDEEKKELNLINECARRLSQANKKIVTLQEDLTRRTDENQSLSKEVLQLRQQVFNLEKQIRKLANEKDDLVCALNLAHECQSELTLELIDIKDKHTTLLGAFHEKQEECRQLQQKQYNDPIFSYVDSLAYELENHNCQCRFDLDDTASLNDSNHQLHLHHHHHHNHNGNCFTPDSLLSSDSFYTSSPYSSIVVTSAISNQDPILNNQNGGEKSSTVSISSPMPLPLSATASSSSPSSTVQPSISISSASMSSTLLPPTISTSSNRSVATTQPSMSTTPQAKCHISYPIMNRNHYFMTDKLRYIKPIEGSQILNHWRKLANPNLNDLFESSKDRYVSRIKANLVASEVDIKYNCTDQNTLIKDQTKATSSGDLTCHSSNSSYSNNFVTTNSVFTFTTTSLSHTKDSMTEVTTTFSDVQPSTGENSNFSKYRNGKQNSTFNSLSTSTPNISLNTNTNSLAQLHNRISLVEQVKSILKVDQLSSSASPTVNSAISQSSDNLKEKQAMKLASLPAVEETGGSVGGLNDLAKLFSFERSKGPNSIFLNSGNNQGQIITKLQMANLSSRNLSTNFKSLTNLGDSTSSSNAFNTNQNPRTNLSVLRNLRKGGLI